MANKWPELPRDLKAYCIQWLWTARRGGRESWWVISHAAGDAIGITACKMDTTKGFWDGAGLDLTDGRPSCMKCMKALAKAGIVPNPNAHHGMVLESSPEKQTPAG